MVIKFFSNKKGGSVASIDYLLNERKEQGTARVLKGDETTTRELIKNISFKQKACVGCLSFTEQLTDQDKQQIMKEFEYMLIPSMKNRVNILWVEHTDKNNLELNFVIPKIDLETKKSFNPYYHKTDLKRVDTFQNLINARYNLTNPKDPARERNLSINKNHLHMKDYEKLDNQLKELVSNEVIKNRDELISTLKNSGIEITRQNKESISIKLPESKRAKRFKGGIYAEQFTSIRELTREVTTIKDKSREFKQRNNSANTELIDKLNKELNKLKRAKFKFNRKRFKSTKRDIIQRATTNELESDRKTIYKDNLSIHDNELYYRNGNSNNHNNNFNTDKIEEDKRDEYTRYYQSSREQNKQIDSIIERETRNNKSSREKLSATRIRISETKGKLSELGEEITTEYNRYTNFTDFYRQSERSFKSDIARRIREFRQQFCENITRFGETLYEQGKRCIKSGIDEIRKFIKDNKREIKRTISRHWDMDR